MMVKKSFAVSVEVQKGLWCGISFYV